MVEESSRPFKFLAQSMLWVLPNPSGINANHQLPDLARAFWELRTFVKNGRAR